MFISKANYISLLIDCTSMIANYISLLTDCTRMTDNYGSKPSMTTNCIVFLFWFLPCSPLFIGYGAGNGNITIGLHN